MLSSKFNAARLDSQGKHDEGVPEIGEVYEGSLSNRLRSWTDEDKGDEERY